MAADQSRATLANNLRKVIERDLGAGARFSVRAWALSKGLDVRLMTRLVNGDHAVTLDKLDEVAQACGVKPWQLLLEDFDVDGQAEPLPLSDEDRALLRRLRRVIGDL